MSQQLDLFGTPEATKLCRLPGCTNPARRVQGGVYCQEHARSIGYQLKRGPKLVPRACFEALLDRLGPDRLTDVLAEITRRRR